jgi:23S rRNA (cytosine1962-C5)-methyltransferase
MRGKPEHGDEVEVHDAKGQPMGRGLFSEKSPIAVRIFSTDPTEHLDRALIVRRFQVAEAKRSTAGLPDHIGLLTNGYRLFHGEGDGLPGLIVDKFDDVLVVQIGTFGMARRRDAILDALEEVFSPRAILEKTTERAASQERFDLKNGVVRGPEISELVTTELGVEYRLPLSELTQKTGFYFDQRPLRARIAALAKGRRVLDTYSFIGPIGFAAIRGGASEVVCVDSSAPAMELGAKIAAENGLRVEFRKGKALDVLGEQAANWDLVVADPPKLAQSRSGLEKAMRAFRRIAEASVRATAPGGIVVLSSCSAALGITQVERCLALGARDAGRKVSVIERVFQGADHPVPPAFPEGLYLSTAIAYVE